MFGLGVAVGDYDNDGYDDLFITALGQSHLFHNNGNGTFTDVAEKAGVHPAIAAGRWRYEHSDYRRFSKLIGRGEVKSVLKSA